MKWRVNRNPITCTRWAPRVGRGGGGVGAERAWDSSLVSMCVLVVE